MGEDFPAPAWDGFLVLASGQKIGMAVSDSGDIVWDQHCPNFSTFEFDGPRGPRVDETPPHPKRKRLQLGPAAGSTGEEFPLVDPYEGNPHPDETQRLQHPETPQLQSCLAAFKASGHTINGAPQQSTIAG